jgi:hypothetical protein
LQKHCYHIDIIPIVEALKKEHPDKKEYQQDELEWSGIESRQKNELNDKGELESLAEIIESLLSRLQDGISIVIKTMTIKKKKWQYKSHFDHLQNAYQC